MGIVVRHWRPSDVPAIAELAGQLGYPATPEQVSDRLDETQGCAVLVAELDGVVAGWIDLQVLRSLATGSKGYIAGLVVRDSARGQGIGAALVQAGATWARSLGLEEMWVRSRLERDEAHRFYQKLGFAETKRQAVFAKKLG